MAQVNVNGKMVEVSDDPAKQKKELEDLQKSKGSYKSQQSSAKNLEEAMKIWLLSLPSSVRNDMLFTPKEIKQECDFCREKIGYGLTWKFDLPPEIKRHTSVPPSNSTAMCDKVNEIFTLRSKVIKEIQKTETSKGATPDPAPPAAPIAPQQPETKTTTSKQGDVTKSVTQAVPKAPSQEKPAESPSTPVGNLPVASSQPSTYSGAASTNKVSQKQHILKTQVMSKGDHEKILTKTCEDLIPIETQIKAGGNQITTYEKDKHEMIGAVVNTFPCIRKDSSGEFRPKSISVEGKGSFVNHGPVSYTEEVENSRFPCGTYSVTVGNKYDLSVGAGGAAIATAGNMRLASNGRTIVSAKEEMNIAAGDGNVNIRAGHNISLKSDSLSLEATNQAVINCNLGVAKNAIINGCAFIDGEVYVNHITCPAEVQYTGGGMGSFGQLMVGAGSGGSQKGSGGGGAIIGYADVSFIKKLLTTPLSDNRGDVHTYSWSGPDKVPVLVLPDSAIGLASSVGNNSASNPEYSVFVYPHEHPFNNIPLSFTTGNEGMRARAAVVNSGAVGTAAPIQHGYKTPV
jgi:hypothetical protein